MFLQAMGAIQASQLAPADQSRAKIKVWKEDLVRLWGGQQNFRQTHTLKRSKPKLRGRSKSNSPLRSVELALKPQFPPARVLLLVPFPYEAGQ
jgi:hypothetical protein